MGSVERVRVEIKIAEVEVDGVVESLPIAVAACHSLDPLDLRVQPLAPRVGDVSRRALITPSQYTKKYESILT